MNNRLLIELADSWQVVADMDRSAKAERRETLRECADMLQSLVQLDGLQRAPDARPGQESTFKTMTLDHTEFSRKVLGIPADQPPAVVCVHCMRDVDACPSDESCDAGLRRRLDALEDELTSNEWRVYQRRRLDVLLLLS